MSPELQSPIIEQDPQTWRQKEDQNSPKKILWWNNKACHQQNYKPKVRGRIANKINQKLKEDNVLDKKKN